MLKETIIPASRSSLCEGKIKVSWELTECLNCTRREECKAAQSAEEDVEGGQCFREAAFEPDLQSRE